MWAVVVAQLVERSLPYQRSAVHWQKFIDIEHLFTLKLCIEKTKIKKKRPGMADFFKKVCFLKA